MFVIIFVLLFLVFKDTRLHLFSVFLHELASVLASVALAISSCLVGRSPETLKKTLWLLRRCSKKWILQITKWLEYSCFLFFLLFGHSKSYFCIMSCALFDYLLYFEALLWWLRLRKFLLAIFKQTFRRMSIITDMPFNLSVAHQCLGESFERHGSLTSIQLFFWAYLWYLWRKQAHGFIHLCIV